MDGWMDGWVWSGVEGASHLDPARSLLHILYIYPGSDRAMCFIFPAFGVFQTDRQYHRQRMECVARVRASPCAADVEGCGQGPTSLTVQTFRPGIGGISAWTGQIGWSKSSVSPLAAIPALVSSQMM